MLVGLYSLCLPFFLFNAPACVCSCLACSSLVFLHCASKRHAKNCIFILLCQRTLVMEATPPGFHHFFFFFSNSTLLHCHIQFCLLGTGYSCLSTKRLSKISCFPLSLTPHQLVMVIKDQGVCLA